MHTGVLSTEYLSTRRPSVRSLVLSRVNATASIEYPAGAPTHLLSPLTVLQI